MPKRTLTNQQYATMIESIKPRSKHSIFFTSPLPLFTNLYANKDVLDLDLSANRLNKLMYFDKDYKLSDTEMNLFKSLISLAEDDFIQFYLPSQERMIHEMSLENADKSNGLLYIYSRKYNIMHKLINKGNFDKKTNP